MGLKIIQLSDLHLRNGWAEEQGVVLKALFADISAQVEASTDQFIAFTGDLLQAGGDERSYKYFTNEFKNGLAGLGFDKTNMIFVPGNHDLDRKYLETQLSLLKGLRELRTTESEFNEHIYKDQKPLITPKFAQFLNWQKAVSDFALTEDRFAGRGFEISPSIGLYILNTAIYSFGGLRDSNGEIIEDKGFLPVETRNMHVWLQNSDFKYKILLMHHPKEWLTRWASDELTRAIPQNFNLVLCGHTHEQDALHKFDGVSGYLECVSPPLFTSKSGNLGYSIIEVGDDLKSTSIRYRQWVGK